MGVKVRRRALRHALSVLPAAELRRVRGKEIGAIFQDPLTSLDPLYTVIGWLLAIFYLPLSNLGVAIILLTIVVMAVQYPLIAKQKVANPLYQSLEGERIATNIAFDNEISENRTAIEIETELEIEIVIGIETELKLEIDGRTPGLIIVATRSSDQQRGRAFTGEELDIGHAPVGGQAGNVDMGAGQYLARVEAG